MPYDSVFTINYDYDDIVSDGDGIDVTSQIRADSGRFAPTSQVSFDGLGRAVEHRAYDSIGSYSSTLTKPDYWDRAWQSTDQAGWNTSSKYDNLDRVLEATVPDSLGANSLIQKSYGKSAAPAEGLSTYFSLPVQDLFWERTTNENGDNSDTYTDILGKVRISRQWLNGSALSTFFDYDDLGNLKTVIKPKGDSVNYRYNSVGWLLKEWGSDYDTIAYQYDKIGNLIQRQDGNLRSIGTASDAYTEYRKYDGLGRQIERGMRHVAPGVNTYTPIERMFYDHDNSALSRGRLSFLYRNNAGRKYGEKFDYDARGRVVKQTNYFSCILDSSILNGVYQHFLSGGTQYVIQYTYNWSDQMTSITYPDGSVITYDYDQRGRLWKVGKTTDDDFYATLSYTPRDEINQLTLGNNLQQLDYSYYGRGWLKSINDGKAIGGDKFGQKLYYFGDSLSGSQVQRNGNIVGQSLSLASDIESRFRYTYDDLDRLTQSQKRSSGSTFAPREEFEYDANGNRLVASSPADINYYYEPGTNSIDSTSTGVAKVNRYSFDPNGNLKTDSVKRVTYDYDFKNQLLNATVTNSTAGLPPNVVRMDYNTAGERVYKSVISYWQEPCGGGGGGELNSMSFGGESEMGSVPADTGSLSAMFLEGGDGMSALTDVGGGGMCTHSMTSETRYIVSQGKILAEYNPSTGLPRFTYIYAGDQRIAMRNGQNKLHYYLSDHLGSARVVIDSAGNVMDKSYYTSFGSADVGSTSSTGQDKKYTGKEWDDEGGMSLYYYGARYYDPALGRFTQVDPLRGKHPDWNPFSYALNNPMRFFDPDGRTEQERVEALKKAQEYVDKGSKYQYGAKGGPGENVDCSGLVSNSITTAGVADPNQGNGKGVENIVNNTVAVPTNSVTEGNLVTFSDATTGQANVHVGIVSNVSKDAKGNVTNFTMIHAGSKGATETRPIDAAKGTTFGRMNPIRVEGFRSWDTPDPETQAKSNTSGRGPILSNGKPIPPS